MEENPRPERKENKFTKRHGTHTLSFMMQQRIAAAAAAVTHLILEKSCVVADGALVPPRPHRVREHGLVDTPVRVAPEVIRIVVHLTKPRKRIALARCDGDR